MFATEELGTPIQLDPGVHTVVVSAAARDPFRLELTLKEGEDRVVEAQLPLRSEAPARALSPVPSPPPTSRQPAEKRGFGAREALLIGEAVVTATGLGLGVAFVVKASADSNRMDELSRTIANDLGMRTLDQSACHQPVMAVAQECASLQQAT